MSLVQRTEGDVHINGALTCRELGVPDGTVDNAGVAADAGIEDTKLQHQHRIGFDQPNTAATSETRAKFRCYGATGIIRAFHAGSIAAAVGDSTVTVDLRKNGVSVLTAVITLDNANAARVAEAGTLAITTLVAGDVLEIVTVATIGTGTLPTGVFASITLAEDAQ